MHCVFLSVCCVCDSFILQTLHVARYFLAGFYVHSSCKSFATTYCCLLMWMSGEIDFLVLSHLFVASADIQIWLAYLSYYHLVGQVQMSYLYFST